MPPMKARYGHTNLVARDWRRLAGFYSDLFGCTPVPPERDYRGPTQEAGTAVPDSGMRGVHLRLPGHEDDGPTLEIYADGRQETWCYVADPEGNIVELQPWSD